MQRVFKVNELGSVVKEFLEDKKVARILGFSGNLGAGKTTFTKELLKQLGFPGNVVSPTFVLRRDYEVEDPHTKKIIHIDAYRLEKPEHIYQVISKEELGDVNNLVIIEWPEKVFDNRVGEDIFDKIFLLEHISEDERKISVKL